MRKATKWLSCLTVITLVGILLVGCSDSNKTNTNTKPTDPAPSDTTGDATNKGNTSTNTPDTTGQPVDGGTLTISTFSDIVSINPMFINDTSSGDVENLIFAKLYDLDRNANLTVEPWSLASELPKISTDGKTYTIKLKNYAKWSDGQAITADDVVYTYNTIRNPEAASPGISQYDKIESVTKVDDQTVDIKLKQVYAPFQFSLYISMLPAHILKDVPLKDLKTNSYGVDPAKTITSGPWKWTEWKQGQYITLDTNPNYWGEKKPHIAKIVYKTYADQNTEVQALIKGDVQMTQAIPVTQIDAVKKHENINVILAPGPQYEYVQFNFKDENFPDKYSPFKGQKTRQAIANALNRQGMVDNVLKGSGQLMNSPFLPGSWADPGSEAVNYAYDSDKAKSLLAEDGWVAGKDGILVKDGHRFSFELQFNAGNSRREQVAAVIQQNLKDVGIEVKPKGIDFATWIDQNITPGKFPAILLSWSLNNPDPDAESIFSSKYYPPTGQNGGWYKNEKLDALWVQGQLTVDQAARTKIYHEIGKEISIDLPYVFLYQYGLPQGVDKTTVHWSEDDRPESTLGSGYLFHIINWWSDKK
ncbi:peptide-binding protein [Paenibacillus baekrokdamisoli]|uniref:Peptide-binding protein n=1 Tax=Paenibacillus baekrokdamisoli TaxID=1712516 RepID=A0A3G9J2H8_9BACL|nr:ABC transporter substrate-binding protein [Paenibacillus baekrokdamisoli]MBB3070682.1 peptide/nickel transport system substrate-binding protein [Paenibacillus baekrokdamisoli]BBH20031.1 peptide-binding protein [Paenibacillus baekrokdamisoli]